MPSSQSSSSSPGAFNRLARPFVEFVRLEASSGILLLVAALAGMVWANLPAAPNYFAFWERSLTLGFGGTLTLTKSLGHWINDGLMALFFFQVGLEIKRELLVGELNTPGKAALPVAAALGGMLVPALIFAAFNHGSPGRHGWGIPMATDIAFSLGVLSLLGKRVPVALKVFLTALAIVDDLGAVAVIAVFYTDHLSLIELGLGVVAWAALWGIGRAGLRSPWIFLPLAFLLWLAILNSGVHATVAGVMAAIAVPAGPESSPPLERWAHALHPWVGFAIMPVFALANSGIPIDGSLAHSIAHPVSIGVAIGLWVGKTIGVFGLAWLAVRVRVATALSNTSWVQVGGLAMLAGIGFTMSIFIASLAYGDHGPLLTAAKAGIILGSLTSAVGGAIVLAIAGRSARPEREI